MESHLTKLMQPTQKTARLISDVMQAVYLKETIKKKEFRN